MRTKGVDIMVKEGFTQEVNVIWHENKVNQAGYFMEEHYRQKNNRLKNIYEPGTKYKFQGREFIEK